MTLKFSGLKPVEFGDNAYKPILDADKRLRLSQLKFATNAQIEDADKVLASCFGSSEAEVLDFLRSDMPVAEKQLLQIYLTQGERGLELYDEIRKEAMESKLQALAENAIAEVSDGDN